jgi:uncharacterized protein (TIGR02145 family)
MAENMNVGTIIDSSQTSTDNGIVEKHCINNSVDSCAEYGGLYNWNEVMQYSKQEGSQGVCPPNWHIPASSEWATLINNNGGWLVAGGKLKETGTRHWNPPNTGATNETGFTAIAAGNMSVHGVFGLLGVYGYHSTSTEAPNDSTKAYIVSLDWDNTHTYTLTHPKITSYPVRCLYNQSINQAPQVPSNPSPLNGATEQSTAITLSWSCSDPDGDPLSYDIYFDTVPSPLALLAADHAGTSLTIGYTLEFEYTYYWKVVAKDDEGSSTTGSVWSFVTMVDTSNNDWQCNDPFYYAGKWYNTTEIGTQCWMAQNMNVGIRIDSNLSPSNNGIIEKYCINNEEDSCSVYGGLYNWNEFMQYSITEKAKGICPDGWHIPSENEWDTLVEFLGGNLIAGGKLKETGFRYWNPPNTGATNEVGFSAIGAGNMSFDGVFGTLGQYGYHSTSTESTSDPDKAYIISVDWDNTILFSLTHPKITSYPVRCIYNSD